MSDITGDNDVRQFINEIIEQSFQQADRANNLFRKNLKEYIQEVLNSSIESVPPDRVFKNEGDEPEIFEIHDYVFVRKKMPAGVEEKEIQVFIKGNILKIAWNKDNVQTVNLPLYIAGSGSRAIFKDQVLELRLPLDDSEIQQIDVQYL